MVLLKELLSAIELNASRSFVLPVCRMRQAPQTAVEMFRRISAPVDLPLPPKVSLIPKVSTALKAIKVAAQPQPTPPISLPALSVEEDLPVPTKTFTTTLVVAKAPSAPAPIPTPVPEPAPAPVPQVHPDRRSIDPLRLAIAQRDPMYTIATPAVKQSIEAEEARVLEAKLAELYKAESGRSRGWTKTHIEAFLVPRAANGAQHGSSKTVFEWEKIWTDKQTSAILDYVCLAKNIRLAVWKEEGREIGLWPAADSNAPQDDATAPTLYHVTAMGVPVDRPGSMEGWRLRAPMSVENALEKLTLAELDNVGKSLGLTDLVGKKGDRVRAIATARMTMRLRGRSTPI